MILNVRIRSLKLHCTLQVYLQVSRQTPHMYVVTITFTGTQMLHRTRVGNILYALTVRRA